jgi:hypothetical protein
MQNYKVFLGENKMLKMKGGTTDEWIKKMWYLYTMEFYAAMKKNEMYHSLVNGWNWRTSF